MSQSGVIYNITIDNEQNEVRCNCTGFLTHGYCKHTRIYKRRIALSLYGNKFTEHIIRKFTNCYDFVIDLCEAFPECIGDYNQLDKLSTAVLDASGKHYATETIHRSYRLAIENEEILEPINIRIRKEKTEHIMHDINQWAPKSFTGFNNNQSVLTPSEGVES